MNRTERALWVSAFALALLLASLEAACGVAYLPWLRESAVLHIRRGDLYRFFGALAVLFLWLGWFTWFLQSSFTASRRWRIAYSALYGGAVFLELGYQRYMGRLTVPTDVDEILFIDMAEAAQIGWRAVDWRAGAILSLFMIAVFLPSPPDRPSGARRYLSTFAAAVLLSTAIGRLTKGYAPLPSICALFRTATASIGRDFGKARRRTVRENLPTQTTVKPARNIILLIDESVRPDHLGINGYPRDTTPFLKTMAAAGLLHNWGSATSGATSSTMAGKLLVTGFDLSSSRPNSIIEDDEPALDSWPTVFHFAKAMGFSTRYYNGQHVFGGSGFRAIDRGVIDAVEGTDTLGRDSEIDIRIAERVASVIRDSTGHFIVIHKMGAHWPYDRRYAPAQARWPQSQGFAAYDNAIYNNVDRFFSVLLKDPQILHTTTILYTSDHGERLRKFDNVGYHGGATRQEASVPFLLLTASKLSPRKPFEARHANILPTLLDLMSFPRNARPHPYAESLLDASSSAPPERWFVSADGRRRTPWRFVRFSEAPEEDPRQSTHEEACPNGEPPPCAIRKLGIEP